MVYLIVSVTLSFNQEVVFSLSDFWLCLIGCYIVRQAVDTFLDFAKVILLQLSPRLDISLNLTSAKLRNSMITSVELDRSVAVLMTSTHFHGHRTGRERTL